MALVLLSHQPVFSLGLKLLRGIVELCQMDVVPCHTPKEQNSSTCWYFDVAEDPRGRLQTALQMIFQLRALHPDLPRVTPPIVISTHEDRQAALNSSSSSDAMASLIAAAINSSKIRSNHGNDRPPTNHIADVDESESQTIRRLQWKLRGPTSPLQSHSLCLRFPVSYSDVLFVIVHRIGRISLLDAELPPAAAMTPGALPCVC